MSSEETIRILLVEDDEDDYLLTRDLLESSRMVRFSLDWVDQYHGALAKIAHGDYDVVLVDYRLGERTGLELIEATSDLGLHCPMILLTGAGDREIDDAAMAAGAADYLVKGRIDAEMLERSIRYAVGRGRALEALRESERRYALSARGANDGLWVWDLTREHVYYSPRWKSMLGWGEEEIGESIDEWFSRVHEDDREMVRSCVEKHGRGESVAIEVEHRMRCRDGSYRWMLCRGLAERGVDGDVIRVAGSQTDVTERRETLDRITHDAFHDPLTQLPNRALFMDRLERSLASSRRLSETFFAVLFVDLDRFKLVNDSLGHAFGDQILQLVASRLVTTSKASDTVSRLGGDEFAILVEGLEHVTEAVRSASRLQEAISEPLAVGEHEIFLTASIGIALSVTGYDNPHDLLRDADIAMYRAKSQGRARHEVFDRTMHDRAVELLEFETDLRRAVQRNELRLLYQPIVSLHTGSVAGFEALLRWQRGERLVSASEIIPIAEESTLIFSLGDWVLRESLRQISNWNQGRRPSEQLDIHVNLSARQLLQPDLVERVTYYLAEMNVSPARLHLELTESVLISNAEKAAAVIAALRAVGIGVSLDDFGTGYSSLSSLRQYRFDTLKIDRSFLTAEDIGRDGGMISTIAQLAAHLGMRVTVEGIETSEQLARVGSIGVEYGQGFFFSRPVTAEEAIQMAKLQKVAG